MGCDIHTHVEYLQTIDGKKKWCCGDYFKLNPYYGVWDDDENEQEYELVGLCDDRNYSLFAMLADVRNYGDTPYIDVPRGLPSDVTDAVKKDAERWGIDGHSHSYFSLQELLDFKEKNAKLRRRGMISPAQQDALDNHGIVPQSWCQGTTEPGWEFRVWWDENTAMDSLIDAIKKRADELYFIYDWEWDREPQTAYEQAKDIRIVFWFDN